MNRIFGERAGPVLPALLLAFLLAPPAAAADKPRPKDDPVTEDARAAATVAYRGLVSSPDAVDKERAAMLRALLAERRARRPDLAVRALQPLGRREAIMAALDRNLDLAVARGDPQRARATLAEAEAVFDPVFDIQLSYARQDTYRRTRVGSVRPKVFVPQGNENVFFDPFSDFEDRYCTLRCRVNVLKELTIDWTPEDRTVVAFEFYENLSTQILTNERIDTSPGRSFGHPKQQVTATLAVTQNLPWGGSLTLTDQTIQQYVYYRRGFEWPGGQWTTNITGSFTSPLPYAKGFGESGANAVREKKARIGAERADHDFDRALQGVLRDTESAYFDLVRAGEALATSVQVERLTIALRDRMKRMFDQQLATRYQAAQLDAEVSKAGLEIERALETYISSSIRLGTLIGDVELAKGRVIYLPIAFRPALEKQGKIPTLKDAWEQARKTRPDLHIANLDQRTAELSAAQARNEAQPDLAFSGNITSGQKADIYGYRNPIATHTSLTEPDSLNQNFSLTFTRPWDNRAALSRLSQARLGLESQTLGTRASEASVKRELTEALTALQTARGNEKSRAREARALLDAYESYERSLEAGIASEDEILNTLRRYLAAEVGRVAAMADRRRAENNLLYAQGLIAAVLPADVAVGRADRERLKTLLSSGRLQRFGAPVAPAQPAKQP